MTAKLERIILNIFIVALMIAAIVCTVLMEL